MASINKAKIGIKTHEGGNAIKTSAEKELERAVMSCMLWEDNFYESGVSIADRIAKLVMKVDAEKVVELAVRSRKDMKIRHVSLHMIRELIRKPENRKYAKTLEVLCERPDDVTEFMALYWKDGKVPIAASVKKALSNVFKKFSEYQLAKYNRTDKGITLKDVMFMVHAKPKTVVEGRKWTKVERKNLVNFAEKQKFTTDEMLYWKLVNDQLASPETWENRLSRGEDKKHVFTSMMQNKELGALAFIRNLRKMDEVNVDRKLLKEYANALKVDKILPFQFITAARINQWAENFLEPLMLKGMQGFEKLEGSTAVLIDVSGSMEAHLSSRAVETSPTRLDVASGLGVLAREMFKDIDIFTFSNELKQVPARRGFALRDAIVSSQLHGGTYLGRSIKQLKSKYDRIIIITDEQSADRVQFPEVNNGYVINVAGYQNSIVYDKNWTSISGWSDAVMRYITEVEAS